MNDQDWTADTVKGIAVFLNGHGILERDSVGDRALPDESYGRLWEIVVDTADLCWPRPRANVAAADMREPASEEAGSRQSGAGQTTRTPVACGPLFP
jgi:glycogen operon protein